jgi:acetylglutamate kinase
MKPLVVKLGGSLLENAALRARALAAVAEAWREGTEIVLVHGGGKHIDHALALLGIEKRTQRGLRVTDEATLAVVVPVLAGTVNKLLVSELAAHHVGAAGISGVDGETLVATFHPPVDGVELGFVGEVTSANGTLAHAVASTGFLPVIASVAAGPGATMLNVNADSAAAALAVALGAAALVFLTDVAGVLDGNGSVVGSIDAVQAEQLIASGAVTGGMQPKLRASLHALRGGVPSVVIAGPGQHREALIERKGGTSLVAA